MNMSATTLKEAVKQWEQRTGQKASQATEIRLNGILPPLEKLDTTLMTFQRCEKLVLSTNIIERLTNFASLKHLKILSIGRNLIKSISGLEVLSETLEELWMSYNQVEKLKGIGVFKKLRVLLISNNLIKDWVEFNRLSELPALRELGFVGNPLEERCSAEGTWRMEAARRLPNITKLDGFHVTMEQFSDPAAELNASGENLTADPVANEAARDELPESERSEEKIFPERELLEDVVESAREASPDNEHEAVSEAIDNS